MRTTLRFAASLVIALMLVAPASAQNCGTDTFGYTCTDSNDPDGPAFDFKDISASGVATGLADDDGVFVPLSFSFPFYGAAQIEVGISSNGYLTFDTSDPTPSDLSNDPIPSANAPNSLIAGLWDDLDPSCADPDPCEVYYEDRGDKFIVQYDNVPHFPDTDGEFNTFQIALEDDGDIRMTYSIFADDVSNSNSYTVGIENADATDGIQAAFNGTPADYLRNDFAVCFDYPGSDPGCDKDVVPVCDLKFLESDLTYDPDTRRLCAVVTVRNNGDDPQLATLELDYNFMGGNPQGTRTLGSRTLPGNSQASRTICLRVPGAAPDGDYNLALRLADSDANDCGTYEEVVAISAPRLAGGNDSGELFEVVSDDFSVASATADAPVAVAPNPFARQTTISYDVAAAADVRLAVYDVLGREVAVLADGRVEAGTHQAVFDASDLAAGTYVYRLVVGSEVRTGRMTLAY